MRYFEGSFGSPFFLKIAVIFVSTKLGGAHLFFQTSSNRAFNNSITCGEVDEAFSNSAGISDEDLPFFYFLIAFDISISQRGPCLIESTGISRRCFR